MKKIIGTNNIGYPEIRNFCGLPFSNYEFQKKQNIYKIPAHLYFKIAKKTHKYYFNTFNDFDIHNVSLFHFFNALSVGTTPWLTTFETLLPRWGRNVMIKKGLSLIARNSCKKIIAISNCTANYQRNLVADTYPELSEIIENKLIVLHPSQKKLIPHIQVKSKSDRIRFTLVGSHFFTKGGIEILTVFDKLYEQGIKNWQLIIVSRLEYGDYPVSSSKKELEFTRKIIAKYPDNITYHFKLENNKVIELFKESDVGLLPSYADTYGYSVLEAQASGCPVITTTIRALPEINNNEIGWLIKVPTDKNGFGIYSTQSERKLFSNQICIQLEQLIKDILISPSVVITKGNYALKKIESQNSVKRNTEVLESIYDNITETKN